MMSHFYSPFIFFTPKYNLCGSQPLFFLKGPPEDDTFFSLAEKKEELIPRRIFSLVFPCRDSFWKLFGQRTGAFLFLPFR